MLVVLVAASVAYRSTSGTARWDQAGELRTKYLYQCTGPGHHVVEWSARKVMEERARLSEEDLKAGGSGYPAVSLRCPECGSPLVAAVRTASGQVQPVDSSTPRPPSPDAPPSARYPLPPSSTNQP